MKRKRSFLKWLNLSIRAAMIEEIRKKRILRENLETWNRMNRGFIRKCEREEAKRRNRASSDESSTVGFYGSDSGDGSIG